jgi:hypothetical protein
LQKVFLTAIAEKMLAKEKLANAGKNEGLVDQDLEVILGRALLQQSLQHTEPAGASVTAAAFLAARENAPAREIYAGVAATVRAMGSPSDPRAINAIVELIPPLAEPKLTIRQEQPAMPFNAQMIQDILKAG